MEKFIIGGQGMRSKEVIQEEIYLTKRSLEVDFHTSSDRVKMHNHLDKLRAELLEAGDEMV